MEGGPGSAGVPSDLGCEDVMAEAWRGNGMGEVGRDGFVEISL